MPAFLLRCDASPTIGHGHVRRSAALAAALRKRGHETWFATAACPPELERELVASGAGVHRLGTHAADEPGELERLARYLGARAVVVDDYAVTEETLGELRSRFPRIAVVDDLADRDLSGADCVLNQNLHAATLPYRVRGDCTRLFGPRFAMLRPQFRLVRTATKRSFAADDRNVLITLGGGDSGDHVASALRVLDEVRRPLSIRCVLGGGVEQAAERSRHEVELFGRVDDMAVHMAWADVSVNAGGSTCWELCCVGVPMIVAVLSRDQEQVAASLAAVGIATRVACSGGAFGETLARAVDDWLADPARRADASRRGRALVDGRGADRAAAALVELVAA